MSKLVLYVPRLVASLEDRTLSGLLLPFGEPGHTNLGRITASAASRIDIADTVTLNVQHDRNQPVGKAMTLETLAEGIRASYAVLNTRAGDDALLEASEGLRCGLSVEMEPCVVRNGQLVSGTITGTGLVVEPAFANARLAAAELEPVPDTEPEPDALRIVTIDGTELLNVQTVEVSAEAVTITTETEDKTEDVAVLAAAQHKENTMANATVQNAALVASKPEPVTAEKLFATVAQGFKTGSMQAALSDIVPANILGIEQPAFVGEIWTNTAFERKVAPLLSQAPLTSLSIAGWEWGTKPAVGKYTGSKAPIPSNTPTTVAHTKGAQRFAGGHDIDRRYVDFGNTEFIAAYFKAMAESYKRVTDAYVLEQLIASGHNVAAQQRHLLTGAAPADVPTALWLIVEGVSQVIADTDTMPTFALVEADLWKPLLYTKADDVLAYLNAAIGFTGGDLREGFKIVPMATGTLTDPDADGGGADVAFVGKVLVGTKQAATHYELGGSPIRVSALDIANAGVDEALYGYDLVDVTQPKGFVLFDAPAAS